MICPNCLEPFEFIEFMVDEQTLEHRGVFKCECCDSLIFPEFITREMLEEDDLKDRLRISKLSCLARSLRTGKRSALQARDLIQGVKTRHLQMYIEHFSDQGLRQLKQSPGE